MDDPMIRSRLGRITGTRPLGLPIPSGGPSFFYTLVLLPSATPPFNLAPFS